MNPKSPPNPLRWLGLYSCVALLAGATLAVRAADEPPPSRPAAAAPSPLTGARAHLAAKRWAAAIDELKRVNATGDADWNNLMGYSLRKQATPDLAGAERHYNEALRIKPDHRGALEYSGELYLMKGELSKAEERLAALVKVCGSCEEQLDLKGATERFKKAGKYVPQ